MRILGIDYGEKRTGLAISDPFGWTSQGLDTIEYKSLQNELLVKIAKIVHDYDVEKVVVGYPLRMDGTIGQRAERTREFADRLHKHLGIEVILHDERYSSSAASRTLHEAGVKTGRNKKLVDRLAAVHMLQGYLDSVKK